jgi:ABC-type transport system involved in cytochrome c biogenesis ATPase subunit
MPTDKLSSGEQRQFALAMCVLKKSRLLIPDEPDAVLYKQNILLKQSYRKKLWESIETLLYQYTTKN